MLPCEGCAYKREVPASTHLKCAYNWPANQEALAALLDGATVTPRTAQWFVFPFNYDPTWGPDTCLARADGDVPPETIRAETPLGELMTLLGKRLL